MDEGPKGERTPRNVKIVAWATWPCLAIYNYSSVYVSLTVDPHALDPGVIGAFLVSAIRAIPMASIAAFAIIVGYRFRDKIGAAIGSVFLIALVFSVLSGVGSLATCSPNGGNYTEPSRR